MPNAVQALSVGAVILFVVVAMPMVVDSSTGATEDTYVLDEGETEVVSDRLEITAESIDQSTGSEPSNATITLTDTATMDSDTLVVGDNTTETFVLSGGNVTVMVHSITDTTPETVTADLTIPTTYGWSDGAQTVASNLGIIVVAVAFIIVLGLVGSVIN